jgi:hypothetical protein
MKNENSENDFIIKAYSRKELRNLYGVSQDVFQSWLAEWEDEWGLKGVRQFCPADVKKIVDKKGPPFLRLKNVA